jgi:ABC-2 type transport system permease protein
MIQATVTAIPRRGVVLLTKAAVVTGAVLVAGAFGVLGSLLAGRSILAGNGFTPANGYPQLSLGHEPTLRAAIGTVLYLGLIALLSLGIGTAVRDTAGAITVVLTLLYAVPTIAAFVSDARWNERLQKIAPTTAGLSVQATVRLDALAIGPWTGLAVLAGYAAVAMLLAALLFTLRDV